jgi:hypothetical protein
VGASITLVGAAVALSFLRPLGSAAVTPIAAGAEEPQPEPRAA